MLLSAPRRQMTRDQLAHVGERLEHHDSRDFERPR
jgi:hypothetical protein